MVLGAMAGKTFEEINSCLAKEQRKTRMPFKSVPLSSYEMLITKYIPSMGAANVSKEVMATVFEHANKPKTLTELSKPDTGKNHNYHNYHTYPEYFDGIQTSELGAKKCLNK